MKTIFTFLLLLIPLSSIHAQCDSSDHLKDNKCFSVESMPEPIGGIDSLQLRLHYPEKAIKEKIGGIVYVLVFVYSTGTPRCTKVLKGIGYGCDKEAIRLVMTTRFIPATNRGKNIGLKVSIPVKFKLPQK